MQAGTLDKLRQAFELFKRELRAQLAPHVAAAPGALPHAAAAPGAVPPDADASSEDEGVAAAPVQAKARRAEPQPDYNSLEKRRESVRELFAKRNMPEERIAEFLATCTLRASGLVVVTITNLRVISTRRILNRVDAVGSGWLAAFHVRLIALRVLIFIEHYSISLLYLLYEYMCSYIVECANASCRLREGTAQTA